MFRVTQGNDSWRCHSIEITHYADARALVEDDKATYVRSLLYSDGPITIERID